MKPRNIFVPAALLRKAGPHGKTNKAQRNRAKRELKKECK